LPTEGRDFVVEVPDDGGETDRTTVKDIGGVNLQQEPDAGPIVVRILAPRANQQITSNPVNVVAEITGGTGGVANVKIVNFALKSDPNNKASDASRDEAGRWRSKVQAREGTNRVLVCAWDAEGQKREAEVIFQFADVVAAPAPAPSPRHGPEAAGTWAEFTPGENQVLDLGNGVSVSVGSGRCRGEDNSGPLIGVPVWTVTTTVRDGAAPSVEWARWRDGAWRTVATVTAPRWVGDSYSPTSPQRLRMRAIGN
jgi:hypothetical protein